MSGKTLQDHHNDGQRDASSGEPCIPPNAHPVGYILSALGFDEVKAEDDAYRAGYENGSKNR